MRRLEKDRIQAGMVLPIDRLVDQGPQAVRRLTKQFSVRNGESIERVHRRSYSQPVIREVATITPLEISSLNGQQALLEDRLRLVHSKPFKPTIKDLIPRSVVWEFYDAHYFTAIGRVSTGVESVNFSDELRRIAEPGLSSCGRIDGLLQLAPGDKNPGLVVRADVIADSIERTTGFRLEELKERKRLLLTRLIGSKSPNHSIRTILVG